MARPLKEKSELKNVLSFRLSDEDHAKWESKVAASGFSKSEFFRLAVIENRAVVDASKKPKARVIHRLSQIDKKTAFCVAMISNNLNQLAHAVNSDRCAGTITPYQYESVIDSLSKIEELAMELIKNGTH